MNRASWTRAESRIAWTWLLLAWTAFPARAHVGNPNVVFEGRAGPFPIRAIVQAPSVVPGLAHIAVRVLDGQPRQVRVLPIHWRSGRSGAPTPDVALRVPGETNLFSAELWLMVKGAYAVDIEVQGPSGFGVVKVPVNSLATSALSMPPYLGALLAVLGAGLVVLQIGTARAAACEAIVPPGEATPLRRLRAGRRAAVVSSLLTAGLIFYGSRWWDSEDRRHREKELFRPTATEVAILDQPEGRALGLELASAESDPRADLVPDHGRVMHLFLVRDGAPSALAHLHPRRVSGTRFETRLPPLPAGRYRLFADVTRESGLAETLTNVVTLATPTDSGRPAELLDADDSWAATAVLATNSTSTLAGGWTVRLDPAAGLKANDPVALRFQVRDAAGQPHLLEPYMGMLGHAIIVNSSGTVFSHVHPAGTISMAAQRQFLKRDGEDADKALADANCGDLTVLPKSVVEALGRGGEVSFPYAFPAEGSYTVWVQVRVGGQVRTAAFAVEVAPGRPLSVSRYR